MKHDIPIKVNQAAQALLAARVHDPFAYLGLHQNESGWVIRVFAPHHIKAALFIDGAWMPFVRVLPEGLFEWRGTSAPATPYRIQLDAGSGGAVEANPAFRTVRIGPTGPAQVAPIEARRVSSTR